ncbi:hypothetical protein PANT_11d00045 [Moesziomyces antarcticus T-34]|uniref:Pinin/SDK/MemA protein domain-containing protein n=1 Tax=Pseudozyma antarctica (strain T-34) TaxID=1151754 RepID=M9LW58_PSEA3|nr:hypothetical protein PANT_11d00045 [Moesziomyces antarcticus T-34]
MADSSDATAAGSPAGSPSISAPTAGPGTSPRSKRAVSPVAEEAHASSSDARPRRSRSPERAPSRDADAPAAKRARSSDGEDRKRDRRMFGLLTSTLTQFKRESQSTRAATLASNRASIEARLATKLQHTSAVAEGLERKKTLLWQARELAERMAEQDAQRATLRKMKRRQASFLFTHNRTRSDPTRLAAHIPTSQPPRVTDWSVYFLPGKTLPDQEDALNAQEDGVDDQIEELDDASTVKRNTLLTRLNDLKSQLRSM